MSIQKLAGAVCLAVTAATSGFAATLDFSFSFTDGTETISGVVYGLEDNATGAATGVSITSNSTGYGIGDYALIETAPLANSFTVSNGALTAADYRNAFIADSNVQLTLDLDANSGSGGFAVVSNSKPVVLINGDINFDAVTTSPIPLPAGGVLLLTGLFGFAGLRRLKKSAA